MSAAEGVIRFRYQLDDAPAPGTSAPALVRLNAWRSILHRLSLLGQRPDRYDGFGFGNVSLRAAQDPAAFLITATQTGGKALASDDDWTLVHSVNLREFRVDAVGRLPPSSEAMTHAMIYAADSQVNCVLHVHSPELWQATRALQLPSIAATVAYGTPELARHVRTLLDEASVRPLVFTTLGHEDGVFACAGTPDDAAHALLDAFAAALGRSA